MSPNELIDKIADVYEMIIKIGDRRFTICDEDEKGFSIAEYDKPETEKHFDGPRSLANEYVIDGQRLIDLAEKITIIDYTGFVL